MSWIHAWDLWFHGHQISPNVRIWNLRLLWWGRFADILAFVSGLSVIFELLGAKPLQVLGKKFTERTKRARLMFKYAPVYAKLAGKYNDVIGYLEFDIEEALQTHSPPRLVEWEDAPEPHPIRTPEYRQLAGDVYRDVTAHHCDQDANRLCVHRYELIRNRVWKLMSETGTSDEREAWKVKDDIFTDVVSILLAGLCWLAAVAGAVFAVVLLVKALPVIWLAVFAGGITLIGVPIMVFLAFARKRSVAPLVILAKLANIPVDRRFTLRRISRRRRHRKTRTRPMEFQDDRPEHWNKPFAYLFHWTGRRDYTFYEKPRHAVAWKMSVIMAQYVLASLLIPLTRPAGFMLNRSKPDHLLRWIFLFLLIISFLPFIITQ